MYPRTLDGLNEAKQHLDRLKERDSMDTSGSPDKYTVPIREAREEVRQITQYLKRGEIIPYTSAELQNQKLDREFPNARSRDIVEFEGKRYQKRFSPAAKSRSGKTVYRYDSWWQELSTD